MLSTAVYIRQIDALRAAGGLIVCLLHFLLFSADGTPLLASLDPNGLAVDALVAPVFFFFVVTGALIPLTMMRDGYRLRDLHLFLVKRLLRFYVPFLVTLVLILGVQACFSGAHQVAFVINWRQLFANLSLTADFQDVRWYNTIFWTLAIEIQFYLAIAVLYPLLKRYRLSAIVALTIVGIALSYLIPDSRLLWSYTPCFTTGMAFYCFISDGSIRSRWFVVIIALTGIATIPVMDNQFIPWVPITCVLLLFGIRQLPRFISWISLVSYSIYLTHGLSGMLLLYFTRNWGDHWAIDTARVLLAFAATFLFGLLFYKYVESTSHRLSRAIRYRKTA